ncbi:unnamed protein product [Vicia faba]|uniref:Reverse transcriptase domain-containing protein n=1 Tax=Vicia faba TaxID=3906 RepID=A0AAV1AUH0_VICFA|nr:unnamed protein product [Vicia faba]
MDPLKAPGPNGLSILFLQKFWHIIGPEISSTVLEVFNNQKDLRAINNTHIVLIPKCKNPASPKDFGPISLCNMVMKLVTKTVANMIKHILPEIIDEERGGFVKGTLITNNVLVAMKCFHWMKKKTDGKRGVMPLKLDMLKTYDRLEWCFVVEVLSSMGFLVYMANLIKKKNEILTPTILHPHMPTDIGALKRSWMQLREERDTYREKYHEQERKILKLTRQLENEKVLNDYVSTGGKRPWER